MRRNRIEAVWWRLHEPVHRDELVIERLPVSFHERPVRSDVIVTLEGVLVAHPVDKLIHVLAVMADGVGFEISLAYHPMPHGHQPMPRVTNDTDLFRSRKEVAEVVGTSIDVRDRRGTGTGEATYSNVTPPYPVRVRTLCSHPDPFWFWTSKGRWLDASVRRWSSRFLRPASPSSRTDELSPSHVFFCS